MSGALQQAVAQGAQPVTLNVVDGEVRDVLAAVARLSDVNLIADDSVSGKITLQLHALDLYTALDLIARTKGLAYHESGNVIIVGKKEAIHRNFGVLHVFALRFIEREEALAAAALALGDNGRQDFGGERGIRRLDGEDKEKKEDAAQMALRGRLGVDAATNSLLLYGTEGEAEMVRDLLRQIDIPCRQVSLEAKVVAIDKVAAKNLGIEWEWSKAPQYPDRTTETQTLTRTVVGADGTLRKVTEQAPREKVSRSWQGGSQAPGIISFGHGPGGAPFEMYYEAQLNALISSGEANILARPNITTITGKEAVINIGGEVPVPMVSVTNATTTTSISYREAGIILRYTPRVNADGFITADVHTEVSSPVYVADVKAYRFNKRSASTFVRLKDGETMVIGGLIGSEESKSVSKIPFLGDLPVLGQFFRNERSSKNESEVMIFLTAHIVK